VNIQRLVRALAAAILGYVPVAGAGLAGLQSPALLLIDSNGSPELGRTLALELTVVSQIEVPASFALELIAPPGLTLDAESLSGALAGGEERTVRVDVVPSAMGDFRLEARLHFTPQGALNTLVFQNAAVLRVRALPQHRGLFVDQKRWSKKQLHDGIKDLKAAPLSRSERDEQIRPFGQQSELVAVDAGIIARQEQYLAAAQALGLPSSNELQALKTSLVGTDRAAHLGSTERFEDVDGLVLRDLPASYVYLERFQLEAGQPYRFETRNLSPSSDTLAVLLERSPKTGELREVARNDDAEPFTLASRIEYSSPRPAEVLLVIRSYSRETRGTCDVYFNDQFVDSTRFGGLAISVTSNAGDVLQTVGLSRVPHRADPWMLVTGSSARWDDDGGMELGAKLVMPDLRRQELILGASSWALDGTFDLVLNTADGSSGSAPRGDLDGDGLSNELERALGTRPDAEDTDGDGLLDGWEVLGVRDTDYRGLGANGVVPDVFVQVDWMASTHDHKPSAESMQMIIDSFAATGLNLHVDDGRPEEGGEGHLLPDPWTHIDFLSLGGTTFLEIRAANFSAKRVGIYHYNIFAHRQPGSCSSGVAQIRGSNFLVTLGCFSGQTGSVFDQAGTFMHELGHNLGLRHGGFQDLNYKPNYRSVMNYLNQIRGTCGTVGFTTGVTFAPCSPREYFYSFGAGAALDENCLDETVGVGEGPIDWNGDGVFDICVAADINHPPGPGDGRFDLLLDYDDYGNLWLGVGGRPRDQGPLEEEIVTCAPPAAG
jgi:hypothetical protein